MRLFFPNSTRPKKASKRIAATLRLPLAIAQQAVARACDYRDWHELEGQMTAMQPSQLDQHLASDAYVARQAVIVSKLAAGLSIPDGDAQYALALARLSGDRPVVLSEQIAIRIAVWRSSVLPSASPRTRGAIGKLKSAGRNGEIVVLREYGRPTEVITHRSISVVADFEYISPRSVPLLFLPMRLYMPYGYWTEADGALVIFSRDYKPMWRVHPDRTVERLEPWLRIHFEKQDFLWGRNGTLWDDETMKSELEAFLDSKGITTLPIMADALPLLVNHPSRGELDMAAGAHLLEESRRQIASGVAA